MVKVEARQIVVVLASILILMRSELLAQQVQRVIGQPCVVQPLNIPIQRSCKVAPHHLPHLVLPEPSQRLAVPH